MQTSSTPAAGGTDAGGDPFSAVQAITTAHLILIAVLAVLVIVAMIHGARLKRRRDAAQAEERERLDAYEEEHPGTPAAGEAPRRPAAPGEPAAIAPAPEERQPPVAAPPTPTRDPGDAPVLPAPAAQAQRQDATPPIADAPPIPAGGAVTQLKGLGPKVAARLAELGITDVGQIAALDHDAADALDAKLGAFQGRMARDRWVEQARFLAAGDRAGFEAVFGRL